MRFEWWGWLVAHIGRKLIEIFIPRTRIIYNSAMLLFPSIGVRGIGSLNTKNRFDPTQINGLSHTALHFRLRLGWEERQTNPKGAKYIRLLYNKTSVFNININIVSRVWTFSAVSRKVLDEFSCRWFAPGPFSVNYDRLFLDELWTRLWQVVTALCTPLTLDRARSICTGSNLTTETGTRQGYVELCRIHQHFVKFIWLS